MDPTQLSAAEAGRAIADGSLSPVALTEAYLDRIKALDGELHSYVLVLRDEALDARQGVLEARERDLADQERKLIALAEELTAREGEISRQRDALEVRANELSDATGDPDHSHDAEVVSHDAEVVPEPPAAPTPPPLGGWRERIADRDATVVAEHPPPLPMRGLGVEEMIRTLEVPLFGVGLPLLLWLSFRRPF